MRKPAHPFRETKTLAEMSTAEWESLCDGFGKCCLGKVDDPDGQGLRHASVACRLLDPDTCQCSSYEGRRRFVPDCVRITPQKLAKLAWLPSTCAYRLLVEGVHRCLSGIPWSPAMQRASMQWGNRSGGV